MPKSERKNGKGKAKNTDSRVVMYPEEKILEYRGDNALTCEEARRYLGWTESNDRWMFKDRYGKGVWCSNSAANRPFKERRSLKHKQTILTKRWKYNHQPCTITKYGDITNANHRLIGFVMACEEWDLDDYWRKNWPNEPTLEILIITGVDDDPEIVNTIDDGEARDEADAFYCTTAGPFANYEPATRVKLCTLAKWCFKFLWERTRTAEQAKQVKYRTNDEAVQFLVHHGKTKDVVKHIYEENTKGAIANYLSPGFAAGMLYLMGCCTSDPETYYNLSTADEDVLDWSKLDLAFEFWQELVNGKSALAKALDKASRPLLGSTHDMTWGGRIFGRGEGTGSIAEKLAALCKAWRLYVGEEKFNENDLKLEYDTSFNDDGTLASLRLDGLYTVGGIDLGDPDTRERSGVSDPVITSEEVEEVHQQLQEEKKQEADEAWARSNGDGKEKDEGGLLDQLAEKAVANMNHETTEDKVKKVKRKRKPTAIEVEQTRKAAEADQKLNAERAAFHGEWRKAANEDRVPRWGGPEHGDAFEQWKLAGQPDPTEFIANYQIPAIVHQVDE